MAEILATLLLAAAGAPAATDAGQTGGAATAIEKQALPPEITSDGLRDELRRAARERKAQAAKLSDERSKLSEERTQLEQMAKDIEGARESLRNETQDLRLHLKKRPAVSAGAEAQVGGETPGGAKPPPGPLDVVAKTLKSMRPDQAALVLTHVDRSLAVNVLGHMRPSDAGAVLEKMKPEQAAQFIAALAGEGRAGEDQRHE